MKVITRISDLPCDINFGLTIGNFDGVHGGHKEFLSEFKLECENRKLAKVVVTFVPHPLVILKNKTNFLINSYEYRSIFLDNNGIDYLLELPFSRDFSTMSPGDFLNLFSDSSSHFNFLYLGHDFSFGANKSGNDKFVSDYCSSMNIEYFIQQEFSCMKEVISSSKVRGLVSSGEVSLARDFLGRDFFMDGLVIKGEGKGKKIGFPTANLLIDKEYLTPGKGVYISSVVIDGDRYHAVTNVGVNPTFNKREQIVIETHILDFDNDIYGELLSVSFIKKLRDEKKFDSVNKLIFQIEKDIKEARTHFAKN